MVIKSELEWHSVEHVLLPRSNNLTCLGKIKEAGSLRLSQHYKIHSTFQLHESDTALQLYEFSHFFAAIIVSVECLILEVAFKWTCWHKLSLNAAGSTCAIECSLSYKFCSALCKMRIQHFLPPGPDYYLDENQSAQDSIEFSVINMTDFYFL